MSDSATIERPAERVGEFDSDQAQRVLSGEDPFDEGTMIDDEEPPGACRAPTRRPSDCPAPRVRKGTTLRLTDHPPVS
jgi:hypothetical protein